MSEVEFESFGKIPRLFRDIVITEKIDGTNAAIGVTTLREVGVIPADRYATVSIHGEVYVVYAQSRKRIITPQNDNFGFARWVYENAETLAHDLGPGLHFGEWWGSGIQRGYGLPKGEKRFSLFNTKRWRDAEFETPNLRVVPVIYRGPFNTVNVQVALDWLEQNGSLAVFGFMNPEGVVVYHTAGNLLFKATIKDDMLPKSVANAT